MSTGDLADLNGAQRRERRITREVLREVNRSVRNEIGELILHREIHEAQRVLAFLGVRGVEIPDSVADEVRRGTHREHSDMWRE